MVLELIWSEKVTSCVMLVMSLTEVFQKLWLCSKHQCHGPLAAMKLCCLVADAYVSVEQILLTEIVMPEC